MSEHNTKTPRVSDVIFDKERDAYVKADTGEVFPCLATISSQLSKLSAVELHRIVGNVARVENGVVVSFVKIPRDLESVGGGEQRDAEPWSESAQDIQPAAVVKPTRVKLERYGCAVSLEDGQLYAYPIDTRGAIDPVGVAVTKGSPEFVAEALAVLS